MVYVKGSNIYLSFHRALVSYNNLHIPAKCHVSTLISTLKSLAEDRAFSLIFNPSNFKKKTHRHRSPKYKMHIFYSIMNDCWSLLYSAILRSRADSLRSHMILHEWTAFYSAFFSPPKWCTYSTGMAGATWSCCHLGAFCVHHTTMHRVTSCRTTYVRCMRI